MPLVRHRPLAPRRVYLVHLLRGAAGGGALILASLALGILGYRATEGMSWLDATVNAAMLLAGEGPISPPHTTAGKLFASAYALFGGILFITAAGVALAPAVRRFLHRFHLDLHEPTNAPPDDRTTT